MATQPPQNTNADKGNSVPLTKNDPMKKWKDFDENMTIDFDPNGMFDSQQVEDLKIDNYQDSDSCWYFDKIFENPYISSTLYFYQSDFDKSNELGISPYSKKEGENGETIISGDFFMRIGTCIVRQPSFSVDNRFDQTGTTPFSNINTKLFRSIKQIADLDKQGFGFGIASTAGQISKLLELATQEQEPGSFWNTITQNALNAITAIKQNLNYLNTVQFESDAGMSRAFLMNTISSPLHATFFFLQKTAKVDSGDNKTNRARAAELLKYFLPHQKLYTSWIDGDSGALTDLNPEFQTIVNDVKESINQTTAQIGISPITDTVSDITSQIFNGGVITTMSPGGFMTSNQQAINRARMGLPDRRTFILITPWGMRMNLLPSNIQITESQSKVIVNGNKVLPMFIQIDVDFIPSRRLLTQDVLNQILNKYNKDMFKAAENQGDKKTT